MICPYCDTDNRDERDSCYHCGKDLTMLRLIVNKAKHHYNLALEHAERNRNQQAIMELQNALDLDARHVNAHVVLGSIYAREENFDKAREHWQKALNLSTPHEKAHDYLVKSDVIQHYFPALQFYRVTAILLGAVLFLTLAWFAMRGRPAAGAQALRGALALYQKGEWSEAQKSLERIVSGNYRRKEAAIIATSLNQLIQETIQKRFDSVDVALRSGDYASAFEDLNYLSSKNLSELQMQRVQSLQRSTTERALSQIEQILGAYRETGQGSQFLSMRLERIKDAVAKGYLKNINLEKIEKEFEEIRQIHDANDLALIRADLAQSGNNVTALIRTHQLVQASRGKPGPDVRDFYKDLLSRVREDARKEIEPLLDDGNYDEARKVEERLLGIYPERLRNAIHADMPRVDDLIRQQEALEFIEELNELASGEQYNEFIVEARHSENFDLELPQVLDIATSVTLFQERIGEQSLKRVSDLLEQGELEQALDSAVAASQSVLTEDQSSRLAEMINEAKQESARSFIEDLKELDERFKTDAGRRVPAETAERVLALWDDLIAQAEEDDSLREQMEFYRAASAYVTGDLDLARDLFEKFVEDYSGDYNDSAEEYLSRLEENSEEE